MVTKVKTFSGSLLSPLATPDGTSLEELVNVFLAATGQKNIIDVIFHSSQTGKYGGSTTHFAWVTYQQ